ncbi:MAG: antibiotic biosynthesis monooxygenase family protein [Desulfocapsaceae bacterium]|nr:antibiotic biosynthesis monooxygenase family protein [Desulfocapsaceae bacterium]
MAIHVVIKRKFRMNQPDKLIPLLNELSSKAREQPGYISTVTLKSTEEPEHYLVISAWESTKDWQLWFTSSERRDLQGKVDSLIGERTFYEIFEPVN